MTALPILRLQAGRDRRIGSGHPWAYSNEVVMDAAAKALPPGSLVRVDAAEGGALGLATFNPHTLIAARLLTRDLGATIDEAFLAGKFKAALALRDALYDAPYYRLVHAEADGLPGLIVDRYGDILTVQMNTAGMNRLREPLIAALTSVLNPRSIVLRNDTPARGIEGLDEETDVLGDAIDGPVELIENGVKFAADLVGGQKTGWFYDQRDNRAAAARFAKGGKVLDAFCYAGGFGLTAAVAGAASVEFIDRSKPALDRVLDGAARNGVDGKVRTIAGDAVHVMERKAQDGEKFDVVIADPPAYVKSRKDLGAGLKAYRKMARVAASLVRPGGYLLVASCSHNVEPEAFASEVRAGLARAQRNGRILRSAGAAADHPVHPFLPESAYLKAQLLQLD
ncbi:class I SAM-dependent rRNA methyltransferase [Lacibacterium aquatile]|uniref:Class I SAM-dependent rRNA methyltransferase n=1 Tax=Lacibacterium aquatile TaxID=1168082 RepID=A0ABW5DW22_9PROT